MWKSFHLSQLHLGKVLMVVRKGQVNAPFLVVFAVANVLHDMFWFAKRN